MLPCVVALILPAACAIGSIYDDEIYSESFTERAAQLRQRLLFGYDKSVPASGPRNWSRYPSQLEAIRGGTDVHMMVRFFKVDWVDPTTGSMKVKVWHRMKWIDRRLSWDRNEYNISQVPFSNPYLEEPEIWLPDITTYNSRGTDLEPAVATVKHTGEVMWSRPGIADVMCKFHGLAQFPFDKLSCGIDMGGWAYSGVHQGIQLWGSGFEFSAAEETAGSSYQEFVIERIDSTLMLFTYATTSGADEPWPLVHYGITLHRASHFYVHVLVWPGIIITAASLAVFYVSPICGERLGFGQSHSHTAPATQPLRTTQPLPPALTAPAGCAPLTTSQA